MRLVLGCATLSGKVIIADQIEIWEVMNKIEKNVVTISLLLSKSLPKVKRDRRET